MKGTLFVVWYGCEKFQDGAIRADRCRRSFRRVWMRAAAWQRVLYCPL